MLKIVVGNKKYSSWSLRPWLVLKHAGVPFEEIVVPLDMPDTAANIRKYSPSGGPFLFGKEPCIAAAFYAPVVSRVRTYSIPVSGPAKAYCDTIWAWPALQAWVADAERETLRAKFHED